MTFSFWKWIRCRFWTKTHNLHQDLDGAGNPILFCSRCGKTWEMEV